MVTNGIQFFGELVESGMRLEDLARFLDEVDLFLSSAADSLAGKTDEFGMEMSYPFAEPLPEILFSSFVVSVVSFMERQAQGFSKTLAKAADTPLVMSDLAGSWYERFHKFVNRLALLDVHLDESDWNDIRGLVEVRNCLAHAGGELTNFGKRKAIEQLLAKHNIPLAEVDYIQADRQLAELSLYCQIVR